MLLTDKYADKIYGIITCYDRMIFQGYIPNWSHAEAMTTYMKLNGIRIFDYSSFSQPLTQQVRQNAEKIAQENGIEIEFIRKLHAFRKDDRIQEIISEKGAAEGLVHIFSAMEAAQKLSDRINPEGLHKVLDVFARRYSPVPDSLGLNYTWTVQQIECATDIMFRKPEYLAPIYDEIIRTAIFTVKPDDIATFLGQRITYNCTKEIGTNYNQRILGTRIKHHMGDVIIKMYDKFGRVLRIESTCNDISTFRVER